MRLWCIAVNAATDKTYVVPGFHASAEYLETLNRDLPGVLNPFLEDFLGNRLGARLGIRVVVRKKQHPDTQIPLLIQGVAQPGYFGNKQLVRNLGYHPGAVSRFGISIQGPSMHQTANRPQPDTQNAIGAPSAYLRNKADTARVMLMLRIV